MSRITPPQDIPSELYDRAKALGLVARPDNNVRMRSPFRIRQPGTPIQTAVWDKFISATLCFATQSPTMRSWWYDQSQESGLFYFTYFMEQTLTLLHQGIIPVWCPQFWTVLYEANELPPDAPPPWTLLAGDPEFVSVSDGIYIIASDEFTRSARWVRNNVCGPNNEGNILEAFMKLGSGPNITSVSGLLQIKDGTKNLYLTILRDRVYSFGGVTYFLDTTDTYHLYRLELEGVIAKIFVDGVHRLSPVPEDTPTNFVLFGNWVAPNLQAWIDHVRYRVGIP